VRRLGREVSAEADEADVLAVAAIIGAPGLLPEGAVAKPRLAAGTAQVVEPDDASTLTVPASALPPLRIALAHLPARHRCLLLAEEVVAHCAPRTMPAAARSRAMVHLQPTLEYWTIVERNGPVDQP